MDAILRTRWSDQLCIHTALYAVYTAYCTLLNAMADTVCGLFMVALCVNRGTTIIFYLEFFFISKHSFSAFSAPITYVYLFYFVFIVFLFSIPLPWRLLFTLQLFLIHVCCVILVNSVSQCNTAHEKLWSCHTVVQNVVNISDDRNRRHDYSCVLSILSSNWGHNQPRHLLSSQLLSLFRIHNQFTVTLDVGISGYQWTAAAAVPDSWRDTHTHTHTHTHMLTSLKQYKFFNFSRFHLCSLLICVFFICRLHARWYAYRSIAFDVHICCHIYGKLEKDAQCCPVRSIGLR